PALPELGVIVISGGNQADVDEIIRTIEIVTKLGAGSELELRLVYLKQADATSLVGTLNQIFARVLFAPNGNVSAQQITRQPQQQFGGFGFPFGGQQQNPSAPSSAPMIPLPSFNAIILAAP